MSRYRAWHVRRWNELPFRSLQALDRLVCLTIELGPYSTAVPGVSAAGLAAMQEASGLEDFKGRVAALQEQEILLADVEAGIFVFVDAVDRAEPANPNVVTAWRKGFDELPGSTVLGEIDERMRRRLVSYGQDHPAKPGGNADEAERGSDKGHRDVLAYIRRWDQNYQPRGSEKPSDNLQETSPEGSHVNTPRSGESETEEGSGLGPDAGGEADSETTTRTGAVARKGERKGDRGGTIGGNLRTTRHRGGFQRVDRLMSKEELKEKIDSVAKMGGQSGRSSTRAGGGQDMITPTTEGD